MLKSISFISGKETLPLVFNLDKSIILSEKSQQQTL